MFGILAELLLRPLRGGGAEDDDDDAKDCAIWDDVC